MVKGLALDERLSAASSADTASPSFISSDVISPVMREIGVVEDERARNAVLVELEVDGIDRRLLAGLLGLLVLLARNS